MSSNEPKRLLDVIYQSFEAKKPIFQPKMAIRTPPRGPKCQNKALICLQKKFLNCKSVSKGSKMVPSSPGASVGHLIEKSFSTWTPQSPKNGHFWPFFWPSGHPIGKCLRFSFRWPHHMRNGRFSFSEVSWDMHATPDLIPPGGKIRLSVPSQNTKKPIYSPYHQKS